MNESTPKSTMRTIIPTTRFRPVKTHFFIVGFMVVLCIIAMGFNPWFTFTLIAPLIYSVWILRVRTTVSSRGITAVYLFRGRRSVSWENFKGVFFNKSGRAFAVTDRDGFEPKFALPAISFNSLPRLSEVTQGRIPDPVTPARQAEDNQVEIFHRDGYSVMKRRDDQQLESE